jgi:hypothetical protein
LDMVVEESPRWSKAVFLIEESFIPALHRIKSRVPLLENLTLYLWTASGERNISDPTANLFSDAPSLARVSLDEILRWKLNWSALTKLALRSTGDVPNFLAILSQMQNLESLDVAEYLSFKDSFHPVTLPSLKELVSRGMGLVSLLTAPALQRLSIGFNPHDFVPDTTTQFFNRSGCTILKLELSSCQATNVIEIMRDLPHITHLLLKRTTKLKDSLAWLTQCRHLQSVTIVPYVAPIPVEEVEALQNLIISRSNGTNYKKLKAVTIVDPLTAIERFDKVRKACIDLQIQFHHRS